MKTTRALAICCSLTLLSSGGISRADDITAKAAPAPPPAATETAVSPTPTPPPKQDTPVPTIGVPRDSHEQEAKAKREQEREARAELAEAEQMADAAIAAQNTSPSTANATSENNAGFVPVTASEAGPDHHSMTGLVMSSHYLGPDYSDHRHHSMSELF